MDSTAENIKGAIEGNELDVRNLEELDLMLSVDPVLAREAQSLLPHITELAQAQPDAIDMFPTTLIPKILSGASLDYILRLIPPPLFSAGLEQPNTAPLLIEMLNRVEKDNKVGLELCEKAIAQILDPEIHYAGQIERLVAHLISIGYPLRLPDRQLYESVDPQLQSRLMALNLVQLRAHKTPGFLFWDLMSPGIRNDPLLLDIHIIYLADLCALGVDITPQMPVICPMYLADEPFVGFHIENVFIEMCRSAPCSFKQIDAEYGLVAKSSPSLLARLPTSYLMGQPKVLGGLRLSSSQVPAFCNLATNPATFKLLNLSISAINSLSFDLRVQLVAAATLDPETARLFVGRFPGVVDAILVPAINPEAAAYQREVEANLRRNGMEISSVEAKVDTAAAQ